MANSSKSARRLKALRQTAGLSVRQMAELMGWPHATYQHYEDRYRKAVLPAELVQGAVEIFEQRGVPDAELARFLAQNIPSGGTTSAAVTAASRLKELRRGLAELPEEDIERVRGELEALLDDVGQSLKRHSDQLRQRLNAFIAGQDKTAGRAAKMPVMALENGRLEEAGSIPPPSFLSKTQRDYAVFVLGGPASRFTAGWLLFFDFERPPKRGDDVLLSQRETKGAAPIRSVVYLGDVTDGKIIVRDTPAPGEAREIEKRRIGGIHPVVAAIHLSD